jgi:hypothetical protein
MAEERQTPGDEEREIEAERVREERKEDLPSQRNVNSPEGGRPPRDTDWDRPTERDRD